MITVAPTYMVAESTVEHPFGKHAGCIGKPHHFERLLIEPDEFAVHPNPSFSFFIWLGIEV